MGAWIAMSAVAGMALVILGLGSVVWARLSGYWRETPKNAWPPEAAVPDGFTLAKYEPLMRLLANEDVEFLRQQRGCPKIVAQWERARLRVARLYLSDLASDFRRLHAQARAIAAESPEQYSELIGVLMRQQFTFWRVMAETELHLMFGWLGLGRIDARRLVEGMAAMQAEILRIVAPTPGFAGSPA